MARIIEAEYSDKGTSKPRTSRKRRSKPKKTKKDDLSDPGDTNFTASSGVDGESSSETENESDVMEITNEEVTRVLFYYLVFFIIYLLDFICSWQTPCLRKPSHLR
jgi:hypothetical protein